MLSNITARPVKRLYTDNRRECVTLELQSFLREQEIIYKTSTLHVYCKGTGSSELFLFCIFSYSMFHNSFSHLYLSAYLISYASDFFKPYTNTPSHLDMSLNSIFCTLLLFCNTLWSSEVF